MAPVRNTPTSGIGEGRLDESVNHLAVAERLDHALGRAVALVDGDHTPAGREPGADVGDRAVDLATGDRALETLGRHGRLVLVSDIETGIAVVNAVESGATCRDVVTQLAAVIFVQAFLIEGLRVKVEKDMSQLGADSFKVTKWPTMNFGPVNWAKYAKRPPLPATGCC